MDLDEPNPFVRYGPRLAWWAFARANGMTDEACEALTREVAGDFTVTPFAASEQLSAEIGRTALGEGRDRQRRRQPQGAATW